MRNTQGFPPDPERALPEAGVDIILERAWKRSQKKGYVSTPFFLVRTGCANDVDINKKAVRISNGFFLRAENET